MPYLAKVSNCHLTIKYFMKDPKFDLSDYVIYNATYSMKSDFSDVKTYTGEPIEYCFMFEVAPAGSVCFDANGGSGEMASVNASGNTKLPESTFAAPTGKQFKGWSLTADGAELVESVYVEGKVTVYAIWEDDPNYTPEGTTPEGTTPGGTTPGGSDTPNDSNNGSNGSNGSDENDGLGAGAIIGIVLGSLAVLGGGGFALYWFVLKKKLVPCAPAAEERPKTEEITLEAENTEDEAETKAESKPEAPAEGEEQ
jgi:hypothetical protein